MHIALPSTAPLSVMVSKWACLPNPTKLNQTKCKPSYPKDIKEPLQDQPTQLPTNSLARVNRTQTKNLLRPRTFLVAPARLHLPLQTSQQLGRHPSEKPLRVISACATSLRSRWIPKTSLRWAPRCNTLPESASQKVRCHF